MGCDPVRMAFIGVGRWARVLADAIGRGEKARIVSCFARTREQREEFARHYGCRAADSLEQLLADREVEAVLVAVPNDVHRTVIEAAAKAGKHVYTEKPIANTVADAIAIDRVCREAGVKLAVGHSARMLAGSRKMKELIDSGEIGQVSMVEANFSNERGLELTPDRWRFYKDKSPGGPMIQLSVHHFDNLQYLLGPITHVAALTSRLYTRAEVDDVTAVLLRFAGGQVGYVGSSWAAPGCYFIHAFGTRGNLFYELDFNWWNRSHLIDGHSRLYIQRPGQGAGERRLVPIGNSDMFREEIEQLADAIRFGGEPEVGGAQGVAALAVTHAAIRSAETGRTVAVDEVIHAVG